VFMRRSRGIVSSTMRITNGCAQSGIFHTSDLNHYYQSKHRNPDPSFISLCLENLPNEESEEYMSILKDVAGNVYMGMSQIIHSRISYVGSAQLHLIP